MTKKTSRFQQWRARAQSILDESALESGEKVSKWQRFVHFWILVWRSFVRNRCPIRASALAYATLLALIPMLAVAMSITSSFLKQEGEDRIDQFIEKFVASVTPPATIGTNSTASVSREQPDEDDGVSTATAGTNRTSALQSHSLNETNTAGRIAAASLAHDDRVIAARKSISRKINRYIQNTRSGTLGVTGSVLLIFAAISMLSRIEATFNDIWGATRGRSWFMRIVLYWGVLSLVPLLVVVALGLATGPHLESTRQFVSTFPLVGSLLFNFGFQILPVAVLCLTFGAFYMLMPNAKVHWDAAIVGGFVAGMLFHVNNMINVLYVSRVVSNSKIYGSLGLVPVFMIGLYFSWLILLFGGQVAYAFQNRASYLEEKQVENINQRGREFIALRLMTVVGQRYLRGEPPCTISEMATDLCVPTRLVRQIMLTLGAARLVIEATGPETAYVPARLMETITCHDILQAMRATHGQELATRDEPTRGEVYGEYQRIQEAERQVAASVTLLALAHRAQSQLQQQQLKALPA
jgi:membrane protein